MTFRSIALGEFIEYKWLTEPIKDSMQGEDASEDDNVLSNMGVMLIFLLVIVVLIIVLSICAKYTKMCIKLNQLVIKLKRKLLWNTVFRFILQSYLKISIGTIAAVVAISLSTGMDKLNAALTFVILSTLGLTPFFINCLLTANKPHLQTDDTKAMMGSLYLGIRTDEFH